MFRRHRFLGWASLASAAVLFASWPLALNGNLLRLRPVRAGPSEVAKPMLRDLADPSLGAHIVDSDWSAFARTDLVRYDAPQPGGVDLHIFTDGETPTPMFHFTGDLKQVAFLSSELPFLAFALPPRRRLLSIGPGGGMDFLMGTLAGFPHMEGVEINASLVRMMERHRHINGNLYHRPGVRVTVEDGRSFVRRTRRKYDLIVCALTQTATTGNVGLALVESYIHTREAFADYFDHLTAHGRYAFVTQSEYLTLRAVFTAIEVMKERGISGSEASRHLLALAVPNAPTAATSYRYVLVWKKSPLAAEELAAIRAAVTDGLVDSIFVPGVGGHHLLELVARGEATPNEIIDAGVYEAGERLNLRPATDDRPFFLDLSFGVPRVLQGLLLGSFGAAALYTAMLLWRRRRARHRVRGWLLYFSALGVGFMLVEIPLAQKFILFLGHPTLSLAAILFYLLIGASIGSRLSQNWPLVNLPRRVAAAGMLVFLLTAAYALLLSPALTFFLGWPLSARLLLPVLFLLPLGIGSGIPFPSGVRMLAVSERAEIPWMWGVNGMMSVVGSTLATAGAKIIGFNGCLLCAAVIYGGLVCACSMLPGWARNLSSSATQHWRVLASSE